MIRITKHNLMIILLLVAFFVQSLISISSQSATFDETLDLGLGKYIIKHHKWDVMGAILQPPLSYYMNSVPLMFVNEDKTLWEYEETNRDLEFLGGIDVYRGQALLSSAFNGNDRLLIASRLITLLVSLLLGYYVYLYSRELFGKSSGLFSLVLFTFCPNVLAFSGIIVSDMPLTAFSFITFYYLWLSVTRNGAAYPLLAGLFLGLALLSKFTSVVFCPIILLLGTCAMIRYKKNMMGRMLLLFVVAFIVVYAGYGFDLTAYFQGIAYHRRHVNIGHMAFLMGDVSPVGWWYFYPVTLLIKTPIALLLLVAGAVVLQVKNRKNDWLEFAFLLIPFIGLLFFFCASFFAIGIRYLLPIFPFMFVLAGSLFQYGIRIRQLSCLMVVWLVAVSVWIAPNYLTYFNEIVGGVAQGHNYLVDSNLDWGQGLKGLKAYMVKNRIERITLSYFGTDSPERYGIAYDLLPSQRNPGEDDQLRIPANQLFAVSVTNLQGVYLDDTKRFRWLLAYRPVAKIANSIYLYDLSKRGN